MIELTFIVTTSVLIMAALQIISAALGNSVKMPSLCPFVSIGPTRHFIMYPSVLFQVWFWTQQLGIFAL